MVHWGQTWWVLCTILNYKRDTWSLKNSLLFLSNHYHRILFTDFYCQPSTTARTRKSLRTCTYESAREKTTLSMIVLHSKEWLVELKWQMPLKGESKQIWNAWQLRHDDWLALAAEQLRRNNLFHHVLYEDLSFSFAWKNQFYSQCVKTIWHVYFSLINQDGTLGDICCRHMGIFSFEGSNFAFEQHSNMSYPTCHLQGHCHCIES